MDATEEVPSDDASGIAGDVGSASEPSAPLPEVPSAESTVREVNGVELHVVAAGDPDDPLVVLLHGYPEFWYGWRDHVAPLVGAGYRVVVPDQRGYNRSEKPRGTGAYRIDRLSGDVVGLVESADRESARVVGHDWGAAVAWDLALRHPDVVDRLAICNVPHPTVMERKLRSSLSQIRRSWYVFFYQLPRIPEWLNARNDYDFYVTAFEEAEPGTFTGTDLGRYRNAWRRDGAVTAMVNWYRAMVRHRNDPPRERVEPPTLILWGEEDRWLLPEMAGESLAYCEDGRLERFPDATHWINHERRAAVDEHLVEFFEGD